MNDNESGLYYLQSRYYDPNICRFINADGLVSTGQGILGHNMFAYGLNNPINLSDPSGCWAWPTREEVEEWLEETIDGLVHAAVAISNPIGTAVGLLLHYNRNQLNKSYTEDELSEAGIMPEDESKDKFHQNNQKSGGRNRKYVIGEWFSSEIVYYSDGTINDTAEDVGTFNVYSGDNTILNIVVHGTFDVVPYMIWGNNAEDSTTIIDRIKLVKG